MVRPLAQCCTFKHLLMLSDWIKVIAGIFEESKDSSTLLLPETKHEKLQKTVYFINFLVLFFLLRYD